MFQIKGSVRAALVVIAGATALNLFGATKDVQAQVDFGEYALFQPGSEGVVGWVVTNSDRSVEWWAYLDDAYVWANIASTPQNRWHLEAERVGGAGWSGFEAWKADVLSRPVTYGRHLVFQNHVVAESAVEN